MTEKHTVGSEKVSVTITRKTDGDLLVSQHSIERWFSSSASAANALRSVQEAFIEFPLEAEKDGADNKHK